MLLIRRTLCAFQRTWCASLLLFAIAISAQATVVVAPRTYTVVAGAPQNFESTLAVDVTACSGAAAFFLVGENRGVSSATILLDGLPIARENDVNPNRPHFEIPLRLRAASRLIVTLKGGARGSSLTLTVRRDVARDAAPPLAVTLSTRSGAATTTLALPATPAAYALFVTNGDDAGAHRVASGTISVNGVPALALDSTSGLFWLPVTLSGPVIIRADLKGTSGDVVSVAVKRILDESACGPRLFFTTPTEGGALVAPGIVTGTVTGTAEVGVSVNGGVASLDSAHAGNSDDPFFWAAVATPDANGMLVATATDASGAHATVTRHATLAADLRGPSIVLTPRTGLAPLSVTARIDAPDGVVGYEADLDGDGSYESNSVQPPELSHTYATAGIRVASIRTTDSDGSTHTSGAIVTAQSFRALDAAYQAAWRRFTDALAAQDVPAALLAIAEGSREKYRRPLLLTRSVLPDFVRSVVSLRPLELGGDSAHYLLTRTEDGQVFGYHVYFVLDPDGTWKIAQF
jgi:hypothetical protein